MDWELVARLFIFGFIGAPIGLRLSRARRLREDRVREEEKKDKGQDKRKSD